MKDTMRKRMSLWRLKGDSEVWKIGDSEVSKIGDSVVWKIQKWQKPVEKGEKATIVGGTEGKVAAAGGSTEAHWKDENGSTEVRNREDVPAFMEDEKYWRIII